MRPEIAFSAADTAEDVQRCIAVLLSTRAGSVAMDREFGLSWDFIDLPVEAAQAALTAEIVAKVAKYEPRAQVQNVTYTVGDDGTLLPHVEVTINE